jgi:type II secretory ATPase GspE/PulE/Tfp pilus assembly ATPase PilB-like protein
MKMDGVNLAADKFFEVKGCPQCNQSGYWGRLGIFELLKVTEEIQKSILEKKDANLIKERARKAGMKTLREDGWLKVREGITTVSEVLRVTQEEQVV